MIGFSIEFVSISKVSFQLGFDAFFIVALFFASFPSIRNLTNDETPLSSPPMFSPRSNLIVTLTVPYGCDINIKGGLDSELVYLGAVFIAGVGGGVDDLGNFLCRILSLLCRIVRRFLCFMGIIAQLLNYKVPLDVVHS